LYIDRSYNSVSQDSRAQFLILHYTAIDNPKSLKVLTEGAVSSHYLVTDGAEDLPGHSSPKIFQLVHDHRRAYHAGLSSWKGHTQLNAASIGIEIVNLGYRDGPSGREFFDYPDAQMDLVIRLVKKIVKEHDIRPDRILGHSDIAPLRKSDPGPRFPWKRLADEGLIPWPDQQNVAEKLTYYSTTLPNVLWFQQKLAEHGFDPPQSGELDKATRAMISAFQMKYRQSKFDGEPDAETAAILDVMTSGGSVLRRAADMGSIHLAR
ncbi:MAG: N-acetylmuramoyl-L-alanine amidase, partial [Burkholderiales bacterium]